MSNKQYDLLNHELKVKVTALKLKRMAEKLASEEFHTGVVSDDKSDFENQLCIHRDFLYMRKKQNSVATPNTNNSSSSASSSPGILPQTSSHSNSQGGASFVNGGEENAPDWREKALQPSDINL